MNEDNIKLYVSLSDLVDTRLNIIQYHFPDIFHKLDLDTWNKYYGSDFEYIEWNFLEYIYARRDKTALASPTTTSVIDIINDLIMSYISQGAQEMKDTKFTLVINVSPFIVSEAEIEFFIQYFKRALVIEDVDVIVVNESSLKFNSITKDMNVIIMSDGIKWLNDELSSDDITPSPNTLLVVPNKSIMVEDIDEIEKSLQPLISLIPLDSKLFCKKKRDNYTP